MRVSIILVLAPISSALSQESSRITITQAPSTTPIAVSAAFIGYSTEPALDAYTTWFCPPGQRWVQDGNYAGCCDNSPYVECGIATACFNTSLMVGPSSHQTLTCTGTGNQTLCVTGTIYPSISATLGVTNAQCWPSWNGGNWNATRDIVKTSTFAPTNIISALTTASVPLTTITSHQASNSLCSPFILSPIRGLLTGAIIGILVGVTILATIVTFLIIFLYNKRRRQMKLSKDKKTAAADLVLQGHIYELKLRLSGKSRGTELPEEQNTQHQMPRLKGQHGSGLGNTDQAMLPNPDRAEGPQELTAPQAYILNTTITVPGDIIPTRTKEERRRKPDNDETRPSRESEGNMRVRHGIFVRFKNLARKLIRPKPLPHQERLEWKCDCGQDLFADISSSSTEEVRRLSSILKCAGSQPPHTVDSFGTNILSKTQRPQKAHTFNKTTSRSSTQSSGSSSTLIDSVFSASTSIISSPTNQAYLEVCINTGEYNKTLSEIDVKDIRCDGELFKKIRSEYSRLRNFRYQIWLLKPSGVHFVKFAVQDPLRVGILQKPLSIPPQSEVDAKKYLYSPCPLHGDPPMPQDIFLHYLSCTSFDPKLAWLPRLPKKLDSSILRFTGAINEGWGIHINEGPNWFVVGLINLGLMIMSGIAAGLWKYFMNDFQGAFGFAGWIVAVVNAVLVAYVAKWSHV